jgi:hypothetical protein
MGKDPICKRLRNIFQSDSRRREREEAREEAREEDLCSELMRNERVLFSLLPTVVVRLSEFFPFLSPL